jgi:squalene-hopene/tetraprenyl-beta-curcumene cyclase
MNQRLRARWVWPGTFFVGMLVVLTASPTASIWAQEAMPATRSAGQSLNSPMESFAPVYSLSQAAEALDEMALSWIHLHRCGSCHTTYSYLVARPALKETASPALDEVRRFFEERVAHWDDKDKGAKPRWDAEVVSTAEALALNDAATTGKLHPLTRKALDRMWTLQKPEGGFDWLKCGWPPLEHDDYYGAIVAALGAGHAPDGYAQSPAAKTGLARLRTYFSKNPAPDLHHQTMLLWASTRLDGLMTAQERSTTIARLRELQRPDGGWNLASLGNWKRRDGTANDPKAPSDGYATGLILFVLRQAGVSESDPALKRGVGWLMLNQRASGQWFTRSLNNDKEHYIAHAGTAFAVLALRACGIICAGSTPRQASRQNELPRSSGAATADAVIGRNRP